MSFSYSIINFKIKSRRSQLSLRYELKQVKSNCFYDFIYILLLYIDLRPDQQCHSKVMNRKEVTHSDGSYGKKSADNMGQGKIPWYSHRLMHRKRVTCELHDSYFCLMTIKHAIPKILSGRLNYYITRWRQEVREFGYPLVTRCGRKNSTQRRGPPGLPLSSPGERERHNADGHKSGGQYIAVLFGLQLPLTRNLSNKVRGIFF